VQFLIMVSFPDAKLPAETFIDSRPLKNPAAAIDCAKDYVEFEGATLARVYCLAIDDETGQQECNPYCTVFGK